MPVDLNDPLARPIPGETDEERRKRLLASYMKPTNNAGRTVDTSPAKHLFDDRAVRSSEPDQRGHLMLDNRPMMAPDDLRKHPQLQEGIGVTPTDIWHGVKQFGSDLEHLPAGLMIGGGAVARDALRSYEHSTQFEGSPIISDHTSSKWSHALAHYLGVDRQNLSPLGQETIYGDVKDPQGRTLAKLPTVHGSAVLGLGKTMGQQVGQDFEHPKENMGHLGMDVLGIASLGTGTYARGAAALGRVGALGEEASAAAKTGAALRGFLAKPQARVESLRVPGGKDVPVLDERGHPVVDEEGNPVTRTGEPLVVPRLRSPNPLRAHFQDVRDARLQQKLDAGPKPLPFDANATGAKGIARKLTQLYREQVGPEATIRREHVAARRVDMEAEQGILHELADLIGPAERPKIPRGLAAAVQIAGDEGPYAALSAPEQHVAARVNAHAAWREQAEKGVALGDEITKLQDELAAAPDEETAAEISTQLQQVARERDAIQREFGHPDDHAKQIEAFQESLPFLKQLAGDHTKFRQGGQETMEHRVFRLSQQLADLRTRMYGAHGVVKEGSATFREAAPAEVYRRFDKSNPLTEKVPVGGPREGPPIGDPEVRGNAEYALRRRAELASEIEKLQEQHDASAGRMRPRDENEVHGELEQLREELLQLDQEAFGGTKGSVLSESDRLEQMRRNRNNAMLDYHDRFTGLRNSGLSQKDARIAIGKTVDVEKLRPQRRTEYERILRSQGQDAAYEFLGKRNLSGISAAMREGRKKTVKEELMARLSDQFLNDKSPQSARYREVTDRISHLEDQLRVGRNRRAGLPDEHVDNTVEGGDNSAREPEDIFPDVAKPVQTELAPGEPISRPAKNVHTTAPRNRDEALQQEVVRSLHEGDKHFDADGNFRSDQLPPTYPGGDGIRTTEDMRKARNAWVTARVFAESRVHVLQRILEPSYHDPRLPAREVFDDTLLHDRLQKAEDASILASGGLQLLDEIEASTKLKNEKMGEGSIPPPGLEPSKQQLYAAAARWFEKHKDHPLPGMSDADRAAAHAEAREKAARAEVLASIPDRPTVAIPDTEKVPVSGKQHAIMQEQLARLEALPSLTPGQEATVRYLRENLGAVKPEPAPTLAGSVPEVHPDQVTLDEAVTKAKVRQPRRLSDKEKRELYGEVPVGADDRLGLLLSDRKDQLAKLDRHIETRYRNYVDDAGAMKEPEQLPPLEEERRRHVVTVMAPAEAANRLAHELAQEGTSAKDAGIVGIVSSADPASGARLGEAARMTHDGTILATHVTDDAAAVADALAKGDSLELTSREHAVGGDTGASGLHVSDVPDAWASRNPARWGFLKDANEDQAKILIGSIQHVLDERFKAGKVDEASHEKGLQDLHFATGLLQDGAPAKQVLGHLVHLAEPRYGVPWWRHDWIESIGLQPGAPTVHVPVALRGTFVELAGTRLTPAQVAALQRAGIDGAFIPGGDAGAAQTVVWNNGAIRQFGDQHFDPIEKAPDTFYTGVFVGTPGAKGEYRPGQQQRKPAVVVSRHDRNAGAQFTEKTIKVGQRQLNAPHITVNLGMKALRVLTALGVHDDLWHVSSPLRRSEYDIPMLTKGLWPKDLKDMERLGDKNLQPADVEHFTPEQLDELVRAVHGAQPLGVGGHGVIVEGPKGEKIEIPLWQHFDPTDRTKWEVRVPIGPESDLTKYGVRWIDRRLVATLKGGPKTHVLADAINNPLRAMMIYGRLAYVLNLPGNLGMQAIHQGFASPEMYARALRFSHDAYDNLGPERAERIVAIANSIVGEGKSRGTAVSTGIGSNIPVGPQFQVKVPDAINDRLPERLRQESPAFGGKVYQPNIGTQHVAAWWSSWIDRHSRVSSLLYEMRRHGVNLDDWDAVERALITPSPTRVSFTRHANKSMVEFNNLTDVEKNTLRHWIFLYPWMSRATLWAFRTALDHPYKTWTMDQLSRIAIANDQNQVHELPSYLRDRGYFSFFKGHLNTLSSINTFSTEDENANLLMSLVLSPQKVYAQHPNGALTPAMDGLLQMLTGQTGTGQPATTGSAIAALQNIWQSNPYVATLSRLGVRVPGAGSYDPTGKKLAQQKVFDRTGVGEALGPFTLGGMYPRAYNEQVAAAKAEREIRANMSTSERIHADSAKLRTELEAAVKDSGLYPSGLPPVVSSALAARESRLSAYQDEAHKEGVKVLDARGRLKVDLQQLVDGGLMSEDQAKVEFVVWSARTASQIDAYRKTLRRGTGEGVLSSMKATLRAMGYTFTGDSQTSTAAVAAP